MRPSFSRWFERNSPARAFREEPSQRLLVWTWLLLLLSLVSGSLWLTSGEDAWGLVTLAFGFSYGALWNLIGHRHSRRRRQHERVSDQERREA